MFESRRVYQFLNKVMRKIVNKIPLWVQILLVGLAGLSIGYFVGYDVGYEKSQRKSINSFEDCAAAGYPIQESFPEVCRTPDGKSFTKTVTEPSGSTISRSEALVLINDCRVEETYSLHNGTVGLILKNDVYQPVTGITEDELRQKQNPACPFTKAATE